MISNTSLIVILYINQVETAIPSCNAPTVKHGFKACNAASIRVVIELRYAATIIGIQVGGVHCYVSEVFLKVFQSESAITVSLES